MKKYIWMCAFLGMRLECAQESTQANPGNNSQTKPVPVDSATQNPTRPSDLPIIPSESESVPQNTSSPSRNPIKPSDAITPPSELPAQNPINPLVLQTKNPILPVQEAMYKSEIGNSIQPNMEGKDYISKIKENSQSKKKSSKYVYEIIELFRDRALNAKTMREMTIIVTLGVHLLLQIEQGEQNLKENALHFAESIIKIAICNNKDKPVHKANKYKSKRKRRLIANHIVSMVMDLYMQSKELSKLGYEGLLNDRALSAKTMREVTILVTLGLYSLLQREEGQQNVEKNALDFAEKIIRIGIYNADNPIKNIDKYKDEEKIESLADTIVSMVIDFHEQRKASLKS